MKLRSLVLIGALYFSALGCAAKQSVSEAQWRRQLERQQEGVRDSGRIGYIGYEGPPSAPSGR